MRIADLLKDLPEAVLHGPPDLEISDLACDSRLVRNGDLFICIEGFKTDGHLYAPAALAAGAGALLVQKEIDAPDGIAVMRVPDSRRAMAVVSSAFFGHPERKLAIAGVTGTNGKTTTTFLIESILKSASLEPGLIGTLHLHLGDEVRPVKNTTPESLDFYRLLEEMVRRDLKSVVMEVSSHALFLDRIYGCPFACAVFTNLTQDHLDFHKTLDNYFEAKRLLFRGLGAPAPPAVINIDDRWGRRLLEDAAAGSVTYGLDEGADVRACDIEMTARGSSFSLATPAGRAAVKTQLVGRFNVYNILAAAGAGIKLGVSLDTIIRGVESLPGVPGRLEAIKEGQDFAVLVDYAHTPDSLENVLRAARDLTEGRLITVFGCGGDRDRTKRPLMGAIAEKISDLVVVTSDNPRTEEPGRIIEEILAGLSSRKKCLVDADRRHAIHTALHEARRGDTVVIAGKGHESYQIFANETIHFDDREVARDFLREKERR
jgi:UDP-N-acetylmuramoyl-L-alanyl-D-glutamate--2,6-diaminopimelate ligase